MRLYFPFPPGVASESRIGASPSFARPPGQWPRLRRCRPCGSSATFASSWLGSLNAAAAPAEYRGLSGVLVCEGNFLPPPRTVISPSAAMNSRARVCAPLGPFSFCCAVCCAGPVHAGISVNCGFVFPPGTINGSGKRDCAVSCGGGISRVTRYARTPRPGVHARS